MKSNSIVGFVGPCVYKQLLTKFKITVTFSNFKGTNVLIFRWFFKRIFVVAWNWVETDHPISRVVCTTTPSLFCKWTKQANDISARFIAILFVSEMLWYRKIRYLIYYALWLQTEISTVKLYLSILLYLITYRIKKIILYKNSSRFSLIWLIFIRLLLVAAVINRYI